MNNLELSKVLLHWYQASARELPWRKTANPYLIWISEVMLQQTRVETVIPYYERWLKTYPDLSSLASSSLEDILKIWEGLGYYSRARNIKKTADILVSDYGGNFPQTVKELTRLPGIGDYIAGALVSIAFGKNEVAMDGNAIRVFSRLVEFRYPVNDPRQKSALKTIMEEVLPHSKASQFNQAVMDLGSRICLPRNPLCTQCPIKKLCLAFEHGSQTVFPLRLKKKPLPHYAVVAAVIRKGDRVLIDRRRAEGLLGGLWEFPGGKVEDGEDYPAALIREIREELGVNFIIGQAFGKYEHAYTHFRVTVHAYCGEITEGNPVPLEADEIQWAEIKDLHQYPMGKVDRLISLDLLNFV